jgi:hypothetical protein
MQAAAEEESYSAHHGPAGGSKPGSAGTLYTEGEFHKRSQLVAQALLSEVSTKDGKIKYGIDAIRVEKALSAARQVIESIRKARNSMHKEHEDKQFELAVISAAQALPEEYQQQFLQALELHLAQARSYQS